VLLTGLALANGQAALAGWANGPASKQTGNLTMATATYSFSGGTPASYTMVFILAPFVGTSYPTLTNTGTTPAYFSGPVVMTGIVPLGATVRVRACSVAWDQFNGTCTPGYTTLLAATATSPAPTVSYGSAVAPLTAGQVLYLQFSLASAAFIGSAALTVNSSLLPVGGNNRTAG
jgi:hypothetical protein